MKTLHLMTQRNQPYGSERRCCEECGLMMVARPAEFWESHAWTDEAEQYHDNHSGLTTCSVLAAGCSLDDGITPLPAAAVAEGMERDGDALEQAS